MNNVPQIQVCPSQQAGNEQKLITNVPFVAIISGPTGSGKSTLLDSILQVNSRTCVKSVSLTTKQLQGDEKNGVDYHFVTKEEFDKRLAAGEFLESATVHQTDSYGTLLSPIEDTLLRWKSVIMQIDVQGHAIIRQKSTSHRLLQGRIFSCFITAERHLLEARLRKRVAKRPMSEEEIQRRLKSTEREIERSADYDFRINSGTPLQDYLEFVRLMNNTILYRFGFE